MADIVNILAAAAGAAGAGVETDPNFNQTVLLLHGDGSDGTQNNTFLDSGTANSGSGFTITRNPTSGPNAPTQGTFSPFSAPDGRWGNFFDGSSNLQVSNNSAFRFDTGDFTIEFWLYYSGSSWTGSNQSIASQIASDTVTGWGLFRDNGGTGIAARLGSSISNYITLFTGSVPATGVWEHYALVRNGSTVTWYKNGTNVASTTAPSGNISDTTQPFYVSNTQWGAKLNGGYISNLRVVKGTALYTSAFTPSTAPLTNITNTSLLTCQSNRFVDNSSNAFAVTISGTPKVTPFSPFAPTAAYSASVNGGSGYFDGSGDYLTAPNNAAFSQTADFSEDCWVYVTGNPASGNYQYFGAADGNPYFQIGLNGSGYFALVKGYVGDLITSNGQAGVAKANTWYHVAITRQSGVCRLFVNGVLQGTANDAASTTTTATGFTISGVLGGSYAYPLTGYLSNFRFVRGGVPSLISTSSTTAGASIFTPPTAPFSGSESLTAGSVSLLLNFTNAGIFDQTGKNNLETVADAQIDTTTKKYGTGSMEFDGTGDRAIAQFGNPNLLFKAGNWTVECWVYLNNTSGTQTVIHGQSDYANAANASYSMLVTGASAGDYFYGSSAVSLGAPNLSSGVWTHCAWVRNGSTISFYRDGTSITTANISTNAINDGTTNPMSIGSANNGANALNGFIDDLRITKGVARYTTAFTPPTKAYPDL